MGKARIDSYGDHLHGCECDECMKTNFTCPACGRENWFEPGMPEFHECSRCMWKPQAGRPMIVEVVQRRDAA